MGWCILNISLLILCFKHNYAQAESFIRGNATCDDKMFFFVDGVLYAESAEWEVSSSISIPENTTVVAIQCQDMGGIAGIKAALDNGIKTDASWKCSNTFEAGWNQIGFNDSAWSVAVIRRGPSWKHKLPASLDGKADWIWTSGYNWRDRTVYCRKVINPGTTPTTSSGADTATTDTDTTISGADTTTITPNNSTFMRPSKEFKRLCACTCRKRPSSNQSDNLQAKISLLQTDLKVQTRTLSSTKRRRKSVTDPRVSSSIIGTTSVIILICTIGGMVVADILTIAKHIYSNFCDVRKKDNETEMI